MNGAYRVIDETNFNILGTFSSQEEAVDFVAALLSVNDADYGDDLTIANDAGPLFFGDSLRAALRNRTESPARVGASGRDDSDNSPPDALVAKSYPY